MDRMLSSTVILLWMLLSVAAERSYPKDISCISREFVKGDKTCVCNSTYCDTVNPLPPFPSRMFNMYTSDKDGSRFAFRRKNFANWINPKYPTNNQKFNIFENFVFNVPPLVPTMALGSNAVEWTDQFIGFLTIKVTVNSSETYQTILGFGGSLSDAAAININSLSSGSRDKLLASYFSDFGVEYNLVRIPIGGTDYSTRPHSLAELRGDSFLQNFKLSYEDINYKIPDLQKIKKLSRKNIRLVATAWSAPPWMKTNDDYKGVGVLKDEYMNLWSKYHLRFIEEYEKQGLNIWAVTTGYQPSAGLIPFYPYNCMGWTPFSQTQWIAEHLGPDLQHSPFNKTKIIILDDLRIFLPLWPKIMFSNQKTKAYVSGIGVQWYWDFVLPLRLLDLTHAEFPDKFILGTEASFKKWKGSSNAVSLGSWSRAEEYAESMINDLNHWVSGWMDSNLVLDLKGGPSWVENFADAAVVVNVTGDEFHKQPMYYAMGHFSKFIPEGSVRIDVKVSRSGISAIGLRTPQRNVVIVLLNKKTYDVPVTILGAKKGNANISLPKKSIMTVIYRDKKKLPLFKVFF